MNPLRKRIHTAWVSAGLVLICSAVNAQNTATINGQDNINLGSGNLATVPEMLDAESAFQIAKAAAEAGEFQTAIVALERVLLINPDLANIKFELGLLYRRVGAPTRARFYLEDAMKDPSMPANIRERAEAELASLSSNAPIARGDAYGSLGFRIQNDSNARLVGDNQQRVVNGAIQIRPNTSASGDDSSAQLSFAGGYRYRFGDNGNLVWNNQISLGVLRFSELESEDANIGSLRTELTFQGLTSSSGRQLSYTPFLAVSVYEQFNLSQDSDIDEDTTVSTGLVFRSESARNALQLSFNLANEDSENSVGLRTSFFLRSSASLLHTFRFGVTGLEDEEFIADDRASVTLGYNLAKQFGTRALILPMTWRFGLQATLDDYLDFDQRVSNTAREDQQFFVSTSLDVPVTNNLTAVIGAQYLDARSNIVNYEFDNSKVFAGMNVRF